MKIRIINDVKLLNKPVCIDYCDPFLAMSLESEMLVVYQKKFSFELICSQSNVSLLDLVKWLSPSHLLSTSHHGTLTIYILDLPTSSLKTLKHLSIHSSTIKEVIPTTNQILTCSIDNTVSIFSHNISTSSHPHPQPHFLTLTLQKSFEAHQGWVHGMCLTHKYLITEGENLKISFWQVPSWDKVKELEYVQDLSPSSCVSKPNSIQNWVVLSNTLSQTSGLACLSILNQDTLQLLEFELGLNEEVQGSLTLGNSLIVFTLTSILHFSFESFAFIDSARLLEPILVINIQYFCRYHKGILVLTASNLIKISI